jgi:DNA-binding transcriptional MocR family regulator
MPNSDGLTPHKVSLPSFVNQVLRAAIRPDYLPLGTAMISPDLLPFRQFTKLIKEISQRSMQTILSYNLPQGDVELRRQLALRSIGILEQVKVNELVITNGCTEALSLSLRTVARAGDIIAIESPAFYGILPLLEELGLLAIEIPTDPVNGLKLEYLEEAITLYPVKACLITPNFNNPLGSIMPDVTKRKLVQLCSRREIPIIEDIINTELFYQNQRPSLLKSFDRKGLVITCSSFSKTLAPGLRIGWMIPGPRYLDKVLKLKAASTLSNSSLDQHLLARLMAQGNYERYLRSIRTMMKRQVADYVDCLRENLPRQAVINHPKGGILLWIELPETCDSMKVYRQALDHKISILPGTVFSASGQFRNFIRIGCGYPFTKQTANGIAQLGSIIDQVAAGRK